MALSFASLQQGVNPVITPDRTKSVRALAEAQAMQQSSELRGLQIEGARGELDAQKQAQAKAAAVLKAIEASGGDFAKALPAIKTIDPQFGMSVEKSLLEQRNTQGQIDDRASDNKLEGEKFRETQLVNAAKAREDRLKREGEANAPIEVSPGATLFDRVRGQSLFTAPSATPKQTLEERTAEDWMKQNPGKTLNDYQSMDANRRRPVTNVNLEALRALEIENKTNASPGQVVWKESGRPVGTALPESAATRLEGIQTAIEQSDIVEQALLKLSNTGAISGYIEEKGVYWPVVQRALTPEQAAAVSETNRLLSAYAQAVSGLAVSEPEIQRLQRSAPSVKLTPEANKVILGHFRRNAIAKRDNYLDIRGWKVSDGGTGSSGDGGGVIKLERGADGKLREVGK